MRGAASDGLRPGAPRWRVRRTSALGAGALDWMPSRASCRHSRERGGEEACARSSADRALGFEPRGRRFDSCRAYHLKRQNFDPNFDPSLGRDPAGGFHSGPRCQLDRGSLSSLDFVQLAERRLDWAGVGVDRFQALADSFLATEPKPFDVRAHTRRRGQDAHVSYVMRIREQPPSELRFAAGDVVHNLRATLDNLVWGLGQTVGARNTLGLEFHESEPEFLECYVPAIRKLPEPIRDWIASIQPYHGRNYPTMFYALHNLWNRDKHRTPLLIAGAPGVASLRFTGETAPFKRIEWYRVSGQRDQQKIALAIIPWERRHEFTPEYTPHVAFDSTAPPGTNIMGRPQPVIDYLRHMQWYIREFVISKFALYS